MAAEKLTRAVQVVELLLDTVQEDVFLELLKYINLPYLEDVIEERHILRKCGYPVCGEGISSVPSKTYHISRKSNKVYDLTERKKFCSQECFVAMKYLKAQMSMTDFVERTPNYKLLPPHS